MYARAMIAALFVLALISCGDEEPVVVDERPPVQYVIVPQSVIPWPSLASSSWPMARHDPQCTGRSPFVGPTKGRVKQTIPSESQITDPAFGSDSVFYYASGRVLHAATVSGRIMWTFTLDSVSPTENPPVVGSDGSIYIGSSAGTYYAIRPDSSLKWKASLGGGPIYMKAVGVARDGKMFVGAGTTLFALSSGGNVLWQKQAPVGTFNFGATSGIAFAPDGNTLYVPGGTPPIGLYALDLNGNVLRADTLGGFGSSCPAVDNDGNVFIYAGNDLVSLSPTGKKRWRLDGVGSNWDVTIDVNGNICFLSMGNLISVDNSGQERWRVRLDNGDYVTHLVSDNSGTVYAETSVAPGSTQYNVYAISIAGTILWRLPVSAYVKVGGPSMSEDGSLLFPQDGSSGGTADQLYIIE